MGKHKERPGVYELYFKDEYLTEVDKLTEALVLREKYNETLNTNSVKLKFRYE